MKKSDREINLLDISPTQDISDRQSKIKTTDINILLNRVKMTQKLELKKRIIFISLLSLGVVLMGVFTFI